MGEFHRSQPKPHDPGHTWRVAPTTQANYGLSQQEYRVLELMADGLSDKEIALMLRLSPAIVAERVSAIKQKLGAASRTEAAVRAIREHLISWPANP